MTMYPHFDTLGVDPDYLWIGACAIRALGATLPLQRTPEEQRRHDSAVRNAWGRRQHGRGNGVRTYASQYVGVAKIKNRWVGMWGPRGSRQGPRRPLTPEGEMQAARDRATALGRDELERREAQS